MPIAFLAKLFNKNSREDVPHRIYGGVVAQARNSALYEEFGVPDTVIGRYDMLALHVFMLSYRLKRSAPQDKKECVALSQSVFDLFISDIERGLRDIGFADTSVYKRNKRFARSYFALIEEFDQALEDSDVETIISTVKKRYFDTLPKTKQLPFSKVLAQYMIKMTAHLAAQRDQALLSGELVWPPIFSHSQENQ